MKLNTGDIVWIDLGISYGWWPCEFHESKKFEKSAKEIDVLIEKSTLKANEDFAFKTVQEIGAVKFFDDEKFDLKKVTDAIQICSYSCKDKAQKILQGLEKFAAKEN